MFTVIAVVAAGRGRGKTSLIEKLCRELSKEFTVWTVKRVSHSVDVEGKDSWRHIDAGARGTVAVDPKNIVVFKRCEDAAIEDALKEVPDGVDLVLVEGFRGSQYPKILVAESINEAVEELKRIEGVFAVYVSDEDVISQSVCEGVPILDEAGLVEMVRQTVVQGQVRRLPGLNCRKCGYVSCDELGRAVREGVESIRKCVVLQESGLRLLVDGSRVYLSSFPEAMLRNVLLAMIGTLKGVKDVGSANISIHIRGRTEDSKPSISAE